MIWAGRKDLESINKASIGIQNSLIIVFVKKSYSIISLGF